MTLNYIAIVVCTVGAFILSSIWYMVFGKLRAQLLGLNLKEEQRPKPKNIILELLRTFLLAFLYAVVLSHFSTINLEQSLILGLLLWVAFPFILLSGSVLWDKVPIKLAAIHAGDWFIKLALIALIVGAWR